MSAVGRGLTVQDVLGERSLELVVLELRRGSLDGLTLVLTLEKLVGKTLQHYSLQQHGEREGRKKRLQRS